MFKRTPKGKKSAAVPKRGYTQLSLRPTPIYSFTPKMLPESKNIDTALNLTSGATTAFGTPVNLNTTFQGPNNNNRIGRKIFMTSISMKLLIPPTPGRIIVVYDKQANGSLPSTGSYLADPNSIMSLTNLSNKERFVVLVDQWVPDPEANGFSIQGSFPMSFYRKINMEAFYSDLNPSNNSIPLTGAVAISYANVGSTALTITGNIRVRFTDC